MPVNSTFANIASRAARNSQFEAEVRSFAAGTGNKTSATNITDTVTAQAGDLIIVGCSWDPTGNGIPATVSVTDTVGTTYTSMGALVRAPATTASGTGTLSQAYYGIVPSGVASQTITVTWSWSPTNVVAKAIAAISFFNVKQALVNARTTTVTTATSATLNSGIANTGDLVLAMVATEDNNLPTGATDTTRGTWSAVQGGNSIGAGAATNQTIAWQYKIVTGQGIQTASWASLANNSALHTYVIKAA